MARETKAIPRWTGLTRGLALLLDRAHPSEEFILVWTAVVVGLLTGLGAVVFNHLIGFVTQFSFVQIAPAFGFFSRYYVIIVPAVGGLLVGPLIYYFAHEAKGHGVPEVMLAVATQGGRIRPIVAVIKAIASAITIGTGGSAGREGPIVQIGSALGSTVGQALHLSDDRVRTLVACGAAGGIAATFNAPIAGAVFAIEVIVSDFAVGNFASIVISAVTASVISRVFLGADPAFLVPHYAMVSAWELVFYAVLGILAAVVGTAYVLLLYRIEDIFDDWKIRDYLKPAIGGLAVGAIGLLAPQTFGGGYDIIGQALLGQMAWTFLLVLVLLKIVATSFTLGSGGSGGVFAPGLFIGAMLGGAFGQGISHLFPVITASPGAYALVGMAAVFSAAARAPLTAILIVFEMSGDYRIILPLMLATVIGTFLAEKLNKESIYTLKLVKRGIRLAQGRDIDVMQGVLVGEAMSTDASPVPLTMTVPELMRKIRAEPSSWFPSSERRRRVVRNRHGPGSGTRDGSAKRDRADSQGYRHDEPGRSLSRRAHVGSPETPRHSGPRASARSRPQQSQAPGRHSPPSGYRPRL